MVAASLTFVTPKAALVALAVAVPLAASWLATARSRRGRTVLGLAPPPPDRVLVGLVAVPLLLGLAAAEPVLRSHVGRKVRRDAQAIFVFDTSRSMAASAARGSPTRLAQAKAIAIELRRDAVPGVPSGVSSLTTQLLPHLFPSPDVATFDSTVRNVVGIEQPPPPSLGFGVAGTSFAALGNLRDQGFFAPWSRRRLAILLTDGESGPYEPSGLGSALVGDGPPVTFENADEPLQAPVALVVVRVGGPGDRIYGPNGAVEATYRPDPRAGSIVETLAAATKGRAFDADRAGAAAGALRALLGQGREEARGIRVRNFNLAPYAVLAALLVLGGVVWNRNVMRF